MAEMRNAYKISARKAQVKKPHGSQKRSWQNIIKIDVREIGV
jgi:hypothetical protein